MRFNHIKTQGYLFLINFVELAVKIIISVTSNIPSNKYNPIKDKVHLRKYFEKCYYIKETNKKEALTWN